MKRAEKIWLTVAVSFILVGLFIFIGALVVLDFDFSKISTEKYVTNTYVINESFNNISINVATTEIEFKRSNDGKCRIECHEEEKIKHIATVKNGALTVDTINTRSWYDYVGISFGNMKVIVYMPDTEYETLYIDTDTGDVKIPEVFAFEDIKVSADTADIACYASVVNVIDIETDTGEIELNDLKCKSIIAESDTGDISLKNVIATDSFSINNDTGDVEFKNSDAEKIYVETSTGDVVGSLLSDKIFITETSTGDINVPETIAGGRCEVSTDTGDIKLSIKRTAVG